MKSIKILFGVLIACCYGMPQLAGQALTQSISGIVKDAISQQPLIGATITILDTSPLIGGTTGLDGRFRLEQVPVGRQNIEVAYLGYEPTIIYGALVTSARPYLLEVVLQPATLNLKEVVVRAGSNGRPLNRMAKVSARSFSIEQSSRFAGGLSDPARVANSFAGVTFGAPQDNGVVVRGNSPVNVLWRVEGVEVPGASHFNGGNLAGAGLLTIYSANVLGTSDFFSAAFPAEYGNTTAGVFDINFRNGQYEKPKYTAQLGVLGIDLAAEGPLKKGTTSSYLVNYRHGFIGYYGRLAGGVEPDYQDLSFKLHLPGGKKGDLSVWGISGLSSILTPYREYEVKDDEIKQRETEGDFQQDDIRFDMSAMGVNHKMPLGQNIFIDHSLAFSTNGYRSLTDWFEPEADTLNTGTLHPYTDIQSRVSKMTLMSQVSHRLSSRFRWSGGIIADWLDFRYQAEQAEQPKAELEGFLDTDGMTYNLQAFVQSDIQIARPLSLQLGLHVHHFGINEETTIEPRAGLKWQLSSKLDFGLGYGLHSRREELKAYFFEYLDMNGNLQNHESLKRKKAHHFVAGLNWAITPHLKVNIEAYYQRLFDVPVVPNSSLSFINYTQLWTFDQALTNEGTGINQGIDLSLERSFNRGYYFLLSASIFDSKYTGGDGVQRNTLFNRGFLSTLTGGKEFTIRRKKKNRVNLLGINCNLTYMNGQRLSPVLEEESRTAQRAIIDTNRLYSLQSEPELWINAGITYKINKEDRTVTWGLDFQNATLLQQWQGYEYNFLTQQVQEERVLFLLPNFYYKIEF